MHDSGGIGGFTGGDFGGHHGGDFGGHHGGDFGGHHGGHAGGHGGHISSGGPDSQPGMFQPSAGHRHDDQPGDPLDPLSPLHRRGPGMRRTGWRPATVTAAVVRLAIIAFIIFVAVEVFRGMAATGP
jgi:hypothetical protein